MDEEDVKVDIPTVKQPLPPPPHLPQQYFHLQHQQHMQQQHQQIMQLHHQHLQRLHHQQQPQQPQVLPPLGFIPNMPMQQINWNIPAVPNVFPFQVNHSL